MGRSVQVDSTIQQHAEGCVQSRVPAEVGTLVGRCAPGKDLVLQALRTPESDGAPPVTLASGGAAKKGGKAGKGLAAGGLQLDEELIVEHAAMVERLLPGGLDVVGFYLLCPAAAFAAATAPLSALAGRARRELGGAPPSLLLLHMDSVTGALSLREAAAGASLRPCECKAAPLLDQLVHLQSRYELSLQLPVTSSKAEVHAAFQAAVDGSVAALPGALGLVGGRLAGGDTQLADVADGGGSGPLAVELLLPPANSLALCTAGGGKAGSGLQRGRAQGTVAGWVSLRGCLDCRACVHRREAAAAAVDAVKADVRRSLQARMDALLDAAEQQQEAAAAAAERQARQQQQQQGGGAQPAAAPPHPLFAATGAGGKALAVSLPRRAFVSAAAAGGIPYCDYLFEGESTQALLSRLQLLLPLPGLAGAAVECLETAAAADQPHARGTKAGRGAAGGAAARTARMQCTLLVAGSAAVAVLALALGYMTLGSQ